MTWLRGASPKPVTIRGVEYPSQSAAARALEVSTRAVAVAAQRGNLDNVGLRIRRGASPKPVTIRGVEHPSQKAAAEAIGVSRPAIAIAAKRGTLDSVGLRKRGGQS